MLMPKPKRLSRDGAAAVEFAVCFSFILLPVMAGVWEGGRIVEIQQVAYSAAREGARSASTGNEYLDPGPGGHNPGSGSPVVYTPNVANDVLTYLQAAEPQAFASGHATSWANATANVPAGGVGYICTDTTANRELFTITFVLSNAYNNTTNAYSGSANTNCKDPYNANRLDQYQIGINVPYKSIALSPLGQFFSGSRINAVVTWASMKDTPYTVPNNLPAS